ncbi:hypothetical protein PRZ48_001028 [Zasmidium cellare]|uniref:Uncharacterized protein n=1 Tax=Zasmidium cellare TaxID=395010 RepID=A0ABR0F2K0_ZASCE|nr:hypothetical protein PRZ48_001028 [Zasmidium cellare]
MAPTVAALAQSESKTKFFHRLGMRTDNTDDRRLDETINETAMHREILRVYQNASERTKTVYELGHNTEGVEEENWIVRWLLWHAFRYRDQRNNRKSRSDSQISVSGDEDDLPFSADIPATPEVAMPVEDASTVAGRDEDVRGRWNLALLYVLQKADPD